jgi:hypothetical protein
MSGSLSYSLSLTTSAFTGPLRTAMSAARGMVSGLSQLGNIATGLASLPGAINNLVAPLRQPITLAADMEALETSFQALLKSGDAAKSMVKDLMAFADATPFDPVPVAQTGKQLLAFGFAAKQVKPLLKDIGDLAAAMEKPIEEVGGAFGRLKAGQFGEAFERFRSFGISMQDLTGAGLEFDKSGSFQGSAEQAMEAIRKIIQQKFGGGMDALSRTAKGLFSTLMGYWDALQRAFGKPIMQSLKPAITAATDLLKQWTPMAEDFGKKIGVGIIAVRDLFLNGKLWDATRMGLVLAGKELINFLWRGLQGLIAGATSGLASAAGIFQKVLGDSSLWEGMKQKVIGIMAELRSSLLSTFAEVVEALPSYLGGGKSAGSDLRAGAIEAMGDSVRAGVRADAAFGQMDWEGIMQEVGKGLAAGPQAMRDGFNNAQVPFDTGRDQMALNNLLLPALAKAQQYFDQQMGAEQPAKKLNDVADGILKVVTENGIYMKHEIKNITDNLRGLIPNGDFA